MMDYEDTYRQNLRKMSIEELKAEILGLEVHVKKLESSDSPQTRAEITWGIRDTMQRLGVARYELKQKLAE